MTEVIQKIKIEWHNKEENKDIEEKTLCIKIIWQMKRNILCFLRKYWFHS